MSTLKQYSSDKHSNNLKKDFYDEILEQYMKVFGDQATKKEKYVLIIMIIAYFGLIVSIWTKRISLICFSYVIIVFLAAYSIYLSTKKQKEKNLAYGSNVQTFSRILYMNGYHTDVLKSIVFQNNLRGDDHFKQLVFVALSMFKIGYQAVILILIALIYVVIEYLKRNKKICNDTLEDVILYRYKYDKQY